MSLVKTLQHLLLPHHGNNHKAKILHPSSLTILAVLLVLFQIGLNLIPKATPAVLGYASSISPSEVIRLTNEKRKSQGLTPLSENTVLDSAALAKGNDMIAKGYWAHFAPDGTAPWKFFSNFGYDYRFAGENLARDFSNAESAVTAWMNSPTHKENILNSKYSEIGIGVVEGKLNGVETTIIVQFFGTKKVFTPTIAVVEAQTISEVQASDISTQSAQIETVAAVSEEVIEPKLVISPFSTTKNISLGIVGVLLLVLSFDLLLIRGGKIARMGGRTLAHIAYFGMILSVILILKAGQII